MPRVRFIPRRSRPGSDQDDAEALQAIAGELRNAGAPDDVWREVEQLMKALKTHQRRALLR
jgi:hypothetical protein